MDILVVVGTSNRISGGTPHRVTRIAYPPSFNSESHLNEYGANPKIIYII
jgi:hypothetical protein